MKPSEVAATDVVVDQPPGLGSEYMDARTYLKQPVRAPRVRESDPTFHGSNQSEFASTRITADD